MLLSLWTSDLEGAAYILSARGLTSMAFRGHAWAVHGVCNFKAAAEKPGQLKHIQAIFATKVSLHDLHIYVYNILIYMFIYIYIHIHIHIHTCVYMLVTLYVYTPSIYVSISIVIYIYSYKYTIYSV